MTGTTRRNLTEIGPPGTGPSGTPRVGPRPLGLHLAAHAWTLLTSRAALPLLKSGSLAWNPQVGEAAAALMQDLADVSLETFTAAVDLALRGRAGEFLQGLGDYRHHTYQRTLIDPPVVWEEGTTRLLDYGMGRTGGIPLMVVPSLVNRSYVLDLTPERSFMRFMADRGFRPFLVDWQAPGEMERRYTLTDYVAGRLERVLDVITGLSGTKPAVAGYCMGGMLALGLATRRAADVAALLLLATPWDFHAERNDTMLRLDVVRPIFETIVEMIGELPVDVLQSLFAALDPTLVDRKFRSFAAMDRLSPKAAEFMALEDWVNDGIPLAGAVAEECLFHWYGENTPLNRRWPIAGHPVLPESATVPTLAIIPSRDRIVPPLSAEALADAIPGARKEVVAAGHIGMITGSGAVKLVYGPVAEWLDHVAGGYSGAGDYSGRV